MNGKTFTKPDACSVSQIPNVATNGTILGFLLFLSKGNRSTIKMATIYSTKIFIILSVSYHC